MELKSGLFWFQKGIKFRQLFGVKFQVGMVTCSQTASDAAAAASIHYTVFHVFFTANLLYIESTVLGKAWTTEAHF